jgi:VWFA-related protein
MLACIHRLDLLRSVGKGSNQLNWMKQPSVACVAVLFCLATAHSQQPAASPAHGAQPQSAQQPASNDPELKQRPAPKPRNSVVQEGLIKLDVVVNNAAGKPVTGLQPWNFKLLDNNVPRKILSFRAFNGTTVMPDPPVQVILVIDMANLPFQQVSFVRTELDRFLHQNGGHLAQPVSIILLNEAGIRVQPRPSVDGNAVAEVVSQIKAHISAINPAMGGEGMLERFQVSVHQLATIAENEARMPGRKLLIWVGPGWPMLDRPGEGDPDRAKRSYFDGIVELTNRLREARMVLYSVAPEDASARGVRFTTLYQTFLKGVESARQANAGNLALKVLVTHTGGQIFGPDNDIAGQINRCIDDANSFYRISFDPPPTTQADEYHDLKVQVDQPGLTVRTNSGYYNEPPGH